MTTTRLIRILSGDIVVRRRFGGETQETTVRWRDKRAQGALRSVGCFCLGFFGQTHIAPQIGNVCRTLKSLVSLAFSYLAGLRHGR